MMRILAIIAVAVLAVLAVALNARYVPIRNRVLLGIAALAPYVMLGAPPAAISSGSLATG